MHPQNWRAFEVFRACFTQWRVVLGHQGKLYQGLDYPGVWTVITAHGYKRAGLLFQKIQLIEIGALGEING